MPIPRVEPGPGPPPNDIFKLSMDEEENESICLQNKVLGTTSPLSKYIKVEHQQAGLFSLSAFNASSDAPVDPQKKRRKKCGACAPCLRKENCGMCTNCQKRKTCKQICKERKCEQLKKRQIELDVSEVGNFEDSSQRRSGDPEPAAKTLHKVPSVHGQMEIGSHDRLQEGELSLELANGLNRYPNDGEASMETEEQRSGSATPRHCWVPGQGKVSHVQQKQQPCWSSNHDTTPSESFHHPNMEDAHNLVAFSAIAGSLPTSPLCNRAQLKTTQLYEKFIKETGADEDCSKLKLGSTDGSFQAVDDLVTLQSALTQAKHGHKPPNCNCDGPECPDYLEWLEKKIKLAASENQSSNIIADGATQIQKLPLEQHPSSCQQINGGHHRSTSYSQQHGITQGHHPDRVPCSKPPIPCSPQVLSIAKEKNISLQTAIAIDALTQLSGTGPQAPTSPGHPTFRNNHLNHINNQNITPGLISSPPSHNSPARSQSVPLGLHTNQQNSAACEHHRSQTHSPHATPVLSSTSPFPGQGKHAGYSPHSQQWQQNSGRASEKNPWMYIKSEPQTHLVSTAPGRPDPMSELKQLLGDTTGKFSNSPFKLPVSQQVNGSIQGQGSPALTRIKQESDSDEHYQHTASMGPYGISNGQQLAEHHPGNSMSPGPAAISHSTQAALQQHLHYKRNLFSTHASGIHGSRVPTTCQNLKKWWPQMEGAGLSHLAIKQEPKKKKNSQGSPIMKPMSGMSVGFPLPKPKQIIIKKTKQKASMPIFLPQSQISVHKPTTHMMDRVPIVNSLQTSTLPSITLNGSSSQATSIDLSAPAQSQVSLCNTSMTPTTADSVSSENTPAFTVPESPPVTFEVQNKSVGTYSLESSNTSTTTPPTSLAPSGNSQLQNLINIDPKYEELIRQFEAEFGDLVPDVSATKAKENTTITVSKASNQSLISYQDFNSTASHSSQSVPSVLTTQANSTPPSGDQEMEVNKNGSDAQSETTIRQESLENQEGHMDVAFSQESVMEKQQEQARMTPNACNTPCSPLPKRMKLEASGDIAVLSTTCYSEEDTPTKDGLPCSPSLRGFLDSPLRYLDTPTKNLLDTPSKDLQTEFPTCTCVEHILEKDEGPYYNHLGSGPTVASIRNLMESRYGEKGEAIRIEKVVYTGKEGKSSHGCPIAKWVIRRGSEKEKLLCLVRHRAGHHCANAVIIILILAWDGVPRAMADKLYRDVTDTLTKFGNPTSRRCGLNDDRTCACQGKDPEKCGASFSFGCSWSMYFNGCKYARSKTPRKFRLHGEHPEEEEKLRDNFQNLATEVAPLYKQLAPQAYSNQCLSENRAPDCRLGLKEGRPFSGITACMDFCAHAHKDQHNLHNGCTVVCTLTKEDNRLVGEIPEDEQLHVLPLYTVSQTDEFGSAEAQRIKMRTGAIQALQAFRREVRKLPEPAKSCRQRRLEAKKAASEKKKNKFMQQTGETPEKTISKTEACIVSSPQAHGNKVIKQEMKPNIKTEPFNGSIDGYPVQATDPFNNMYQHPAYYARGVPSPAGQPSTAEAVNGYHPSLPTIPYGFYNYSPNALFPRKLRTYEGRNGSLIKTGGRPVEVDKKPDIHSLQARLAQSPFSHSEQTNQSNYGAYTQSTDHSLSRPSSVSSESSNRATPVIKKEPVDVPVYEDTLPTQANVSTSRTTPQPAAWQGYKLNRGVTPTSWDLNRQTPEASALSSNKQQFHQHSQQRSSPFPQQWTSCPSSTPQMSSQSLQVTPSPPPSPHVGTGLQTNIQQGSTCYATSQPGTPQPGPSLSGSVTPQPSTPGQRTPRHWGSPAQSPQPNPWAMGPGAYSPGLKHSNPAGAYPDKIWPKTGENRCSTPLGLQEKAWKSCGGSLAGSTPSPAPEGRLFPDALQQSGQGYCDQSRAESDVESIKHQEEDEEVWSDSEHNFLDPRIGGVAVAPTHGSILIECARRELHATTPIKKPDRTHPTRISLVFYQHKNLNQPMHGLALWEAKMKLLAERAMQRQQEAALLGLSQEEIKTLGKKRKWGATLAGTSPGHGQSKEKRDGTVTRLAPTFYTTSTVTVSTYAFTRLTGPYSHFV